MNRSEEILRKEVMEALRQVMVPERNASVYDLELVHDVRIEKGVVRLVFSPQAMLCSSVQVAFNIRHAVRLVDGVRKVEIHVADFERVTISGKED